MKMKLWSQDTCCLAGTKDPIIPHNWSVVDYRETVEQGSLYCKIFTVGSELRQGTSGRKCPKMCIASVWELCKNSNYKNNKNGIVLARGNQSLGSIYRTHVLQPESREC